jgi:hypothetical protein
MNIMKTSHLVALALFAASISSAGVIFSTGNIPQIDSNVLFNCSTICSNGPPSVVGHLQQVTPDTAVDFTSAEGLTVMGPGSNAVSGQNSTTGFDDMAITVPGHTFTSIILQLTSLASATDGTVTFTALTTAGGPFVSTALFDSHTGGNYFTITANSGTLITELDFITTQFQDNVSQVRIGGVSGVTTVPEPATFGLAGAALVGLALFRRRRPR